MDKLCITDQVCHYMCFYKSVREIEVLASAQQVVFDVSRTGTCVDFIFCVSSVELDWFAATSPVSTRCGRPRLCPIRSSSHLDRCS